VPTSTSSDDRADAIIAEHKPFIQPAEFFAENGASSQPLAEYWVLVCSFGKPQ
jgi:hypothetical protein